MKKLLLLLACWGLGMGSYAQTLQYDFSKFTPLQSSGTLPAVVNMSGRDFITASQKNVNAVGDRSDKKAKKQFVLQTSYSVKDIFNSGKVLYNDPVSRYVERIHKVITESDPQLASETKVFVFKSSIVNAFATNQGYIFITTGLLAQVKNEAQLAFVLCHELVHYKNKHVVKAYIKNKKLDDKRSVYSSDIEDRYLAKARYSRENESEADKDGFNLFAKTKYDFASVNALFDVLKNSHMPFEDIPFDGRIIFETEHLKLPENYYKEKVTEIELPEDEEGDDDSESTHPNINKRKSDIEAKIIALDDKSQRSFYIVSEVDFKAAQKLARFDICHTNLIDRNFDRALYNAYSLLQNDKDNLYLNKVILKSLYALTKYANHNGLEDVIEKPYKVAGEQQKLSYTIDKLKDNELNVIALNYAWRFKMSLPYPDKEVDLIVEDLFYELVKKHYADKSFFSEVPKSAVVIDTVKKNAGKSEIESIEGVEKPKEGDDRPLTKTEKIKKKRKKNQEEGEKHEDGFIEYAFVDLLKDKDFVAMYDSTIALIHKQRDEKAGKRQKNKDRGDNDVDEEENTYDSRCDCYSLGIKRVLVVNPFYLKIDQRKDVPVLYKVGENSQKKFNEEILDIAKDADIQVEILDRNSLDTLSVDDYNDMAVLIDWVTEGNERRDFKMIPVDYTRINEIATKHGVDDIAVMGVVNFVEKKEYAGLVVLASIMMPVYSWPFTMPYLLRKRSHTYVFSLVFNISTGQSKMNNTGNVVLSDGKDVIRTFLYDHLKQMSRKIKANN